MKPGEGALTPMAAGFLRWNAIVRPSESATEAGSRDIGLRTG
jgi:hypothetical protein